MQNQHFSRRSILKVLTVLPFGGALFGNFLASSVKADQPNMENALAALRTARRELEQATTDKGGHRARAIKHVEQAIQEVEQGIRFDRRH